MPRERFSDDDWQAIGEFVKSEFARRQEKRDGLEKLWKEIDRQIAMTPVPRRVESGKEADWFPNTEMPLQFNALEVIAADARRLKFPRGTEWFEVKAEFSDKYEARFNQRRQENPLSGDTPLPVKLDQEGADTLVKTVLDHYHRLYDFRGQIDLFDTEAIKYGTAIARVRPVKTAKFSHDFRGQRNVNLVGPAVITCSIKNTYLDDRQTAVLHEGIATTPAIIRVNMQHIDALKRAAKKGGKKNGWIFSQLKKIEDPADDDGKRGFVEMLEYEGDLIVPRSQGSIFLPNVIVTVTVRAGIAFPVRFRKSPVPFKSYVVGHYMRDDVRSAYGSSPLMKGQPIQEACTMVFNNLMATAAFNGRPPITYDRHDTEMAAGGGPELYPGAQFGADSPNAVEVLKVGDIGGLLNVYLALLKQYEDLTGANDPRRGAAIKSHTTAGGAELEAARGIARTDDFVTSIEQGPLTSMLYMEYEIIKDVMKSPQPVSVGAGGIEGWVNVAAADLADNAVFVVQGSAGAITEREQGEKFLAASNFALSVATQAAQLGKPVNLRFDEMIVEGYKIAGIQNATRFIGGPEAIPGGAEAGPQIPGANGGVQPGTAPPVAPQ